MTTLLSLTNLLDQHIRRRLSILYGDWTITLNGYGLELVPSDRWAGLAEAEREAGREEIVAHWNEHLRIPADGFSGR